MNCCNNCINDSTLDGQFSAANKIGRCDYCNRENVLLLESLSLRIKIEPLLEHYRPISKLELYQPEDAADSKGNIISQINSDWNDIFLAPNNEKLLKDILAENFEDYKELFEENVLLEAKYEKKNRKRNLERQKLWEDFKTEIKEKFRFRRVESSKIEEFSTLLKHLAVKIPKGGSLFRARISDETGFNIGELGAPDSSKASAGRANPKGISYLYLSRDEKTTVYEVRAGLHDYITVGTFKVLENLHVINFRPVREISPFLLNDVELIDIVEYDSFIQDLMQDLSKPNRKFNSDIDYIPTQYVVEMAKDIHGIDGVEFPSSMDKDGRNIVLFSDKKVECVARKIYSVNSIKYDYNDV